MHTIPKIVRERLKATTPAVNHPDADVLTAFAEQALPAAERNAVLDHLSRCGDCRDVVALALPATEATEIAPSPASSGWLTSPGFTWPTLRWGFVAVGVVAIASIGILQYRRRVAPETMASKQAPHYAPDYEVAANEARTQPPAATATPAPAEKRDEARAIPHTSLDSGSAGGTSLALTESKPRAPAGVPPRVHVPQTTNGISGSVLGGPVLHGSVAANAWQQQGQSQGQQDLGLAAPSAAKKEQTAELSKTVPVPTVSETVEVQGQSAAVAIDQSEEAKLSDQGVAKAKPAATTQANAPAPAPKLASPPAAQFDRMQAFAVPLPRWTISATGTLQRSFDQGNTWQGVDVSSVSALSSNLVSRDLDAKTSRLKAKDADKETLKQETTTPTFRAVTATGPDVWAGGSDGVLYHSLDAGTHWTRVVPSAAGVLLSGDIVSLEFSDARHGKITTSASEVWTTSDDGQTWQKQ